MRRLTTADERPTVQRVIMSRRPAKSGRAEILASLAPATEHLLRALSEVTAAAQSALEAVPLASRVRDSDALRSGKAALGLLTSLASAGAATARKRARTEMRREAFGEILEAIDERASRLTGAAADALGTVRDAIADAAGASARPKPKSKKSRRPRRKPESR